MNGEKLNLAENRWIRFEFDPFVGALPKELFRVAGNYAIIIDGKVNYIGQSQNLHTRLYEHQLAVGFSPLSKMEIAIRVESNKEKCKIEDKFIKKLHPPANKQISIPRCKKNWEPDYKDKFIERFAASLKHGA